MNELTAALKEELNVDTAFTLPIFGGIDIPESIAVSWGIMFQEKSYFVTSECFRYKYT